MRTCRRGLQSSSAWRSKTFWMSGSGRRARIRSFHYNRTQKRTWRAAFGAARHVFFALPTRRIVSRAEPRLTCEGRARRSLERPARPSRPPTFGSPSAVRASRPVRPWNDPPFETIAATPGRRRRRLYASCERSRRCCHCHAPRRERSPTDRETGPAAHQLPRRFLPAWLFASGRPWPAPSSAQTAPG